MRSWNCFSCVATNHAMMKLLSLIIVLCIYKRDWWLQIAFFNYHFQTRHVLPPCSFFHGSINQHISLVCLPIWKETTGGSKLSPSNVLFRLHNPMRLSGFFPMPHVPSSPWPPLPLVPPCHRRQDLRVTIHSPAISVLSVATARPQ
jgi:hypothetical protein